MLNKSIFLSDVPVDTVAENLLWAQDSNVLQEVSSITNAILLEDGKLTFAVHGTWGAGKTSFLKMVEDTVIQSKDNQEVVFCWYDASTYQGIGIPETTIALRIWSVLGGEDPEKGRYAGDSFDALTRYMRGVLDEMGIDEIRPFEALQALARRTGQLADFPRLLQEALVEGGPPEGLPKKLVLVVDDLDRCRNEFIGQILDVLQRFSSVRNLFTLIGVDRKVLLTAIRTRYEEAMSVHDEHLASEKHIQYAVDLPEMTPHLLTRYIQRCLTLEESDNKLENQVIKAIRENANYFVAGVRVKTPRAIKRSINAIRPTLEMRLAQQPELSQEDQQLIIKEQLLSYNWRDFYQRYFQPARHNPNSSESRIFGVLEQLCATSFPMEEKEITPELRRDRRAIFELQLERLKTREFSESASLEIKDELARLLGQGPFWFYGRREGRQAARTTDIVDQIAAIEFGGPSMEEEFVKFYILSEQADAAGDGRASVQAAAQAYDLVRRNRQSFGKDIAPRLGNLGVNAEKYKVLDLAEQIWRLALKIDSEHSGTLQQFASYIIDNRPDLYSEAEGILTKLQTGSHAAHRSWRTLSLSAQLKSALGQELDKDLLAQLTKAAETETDARQLGDILNTMIGAGQFRQGVSLFALALGRFPSTKSRYTLQRIVADALANRPEIESEFIAMDLYRQILANPETIDPGDEPHVMANYATLLYKHDYNDEAGCLWFTAYRLPSGRGQPGIRRAYSMYLLRTGRTDLAEKVINGEPIEEMELIPTDKKLPERFSDVELPDALNEGGEPSSFKYLEGQVS